MARNLQAKLPATDTLRVYDINTEMAQKFAHETKGVGNGAAVTIAKDVRDAAEDSVCASVVSVHFNRSYMMSLFQLQ